MTNVKQAIVRDSTPRVFDRNQARGGRQIVQTRMDPKLSVYGLASRAASVQTQSLQTPALMRAVPATFGASSHEDFARHAHAI